MARPLRNKSAKEFKTSILRALGAIDYESVLIRKLKDDIQAGDYTMFTSVLQLASKFVPKETTQEGKIVVQLELPHIASPALVQEVEVIDITPKDSPKDTLEDTPV